MSMLPFPNECVAKTVVGKHVSIIIVINSLAMVAVNLFVMAFASLYGTIPTTTSGTAGVISSHNCGKWTNKYSNPFKCEYVSIIFIYRRFPPVAATQMEFALSFLFLLVEKLACLKDGFLKCPLATN